MIRRAYEPLDPYIRPGKVLIIYGPRQVGKTTLLQRFLADTPLRYRFAVGDDLPTQNLFSALDLRLLRDYLEGYELLAIDEAQYIPDIGRALKLIVDHLPEMRVVATGSSSFELAGQVGEPLTGRKQTLVLYPLAQSELLSVHSRFDLRQRLEEFLIFGTYPEVVTAQSRREKMDLIREIAGSYLLKDILTFERVRGSRQLWDLLRLLAFQVGSEVSAHELATSLGMQYKTVQRYLDLLEQAFVLFRLGGFSRNLRNEVTAKAKYYFYDTGIRNAVIARFHRLEERDDVGALWENFMVMERLKVLSYAREPVNLYFWRTYSRHEIDLVEERGAQLRAFEFKWSTQTRPRSPRAWQRAYPAAEFSVITPENYLDFLLGNAEEPSA